MNKSDWQEDLVFSSQSQRKGYGVSTKPAKSKDTRIRVRMIWGVFVVGIALLMAKLIYLQVVAEGQYRLNAYNNHVELKRQVADRGVVYDRNKVELVINVPAGDKQTRVYPLGPAIAPVMGYISEVKEDEVGCQEGLCYSRGMYVGRSGVEKEFEVQLRGRDGGKLIEVDSSGQEIREMGGNLPESGNEIVLSLDSRLQKNMYEALGGKKGSAVALDMQGKVLGLVSSPAYDPAHLEDFLSDKEQLYFLNRAIAGTYPPGSVYKLVTSLAGLSEGKIEYDTEFEDTGEIKVGSYRYGNWYFDQYGGKEGSISVVRALARSNDIFFYKTGEEIGVDKLVSWSKKFGLGGKSGIELTGEKAGLVPDRLWKERATGEKWFLGNTYHMAIGQGDLLTTPAQVARMTLAAVTGRLCQVTLLKENKVECSEIGLKTEDIAVVREGMRQACETGGTAFPLFDFEPYVECKTGTAQHSGQSKNDSLSEADKVLPHAWITIAYPGENPEMILTVMLEAAGEGSAVAGGVARTILDGWKAIGK